MTNAEGTRSRQDGTRARRAPRVRSALFVPGNRERWVARASTYGADVVVVDLEDAVPPSQKVSAREIVRALVPILVAEGQNTWVRVNDLSTDLTWDDLEAACGAAANGICLPKAVTAETVSDVDRMITYWEGHHGIALGETALIPLVEDAAAISEARAIFSASPRAHYCGAVVTSRGDAELSVGFRWTDSFRETFVLRSQLLLMARAAGSPNPLAGIVTCLDNEQVERFARESRSIGYSGIYVIHPFHVPIANAVFSLSQEEVSWAQEVVAAYEQNALTGEGAFTDSRGYLVDSAHYRKALEIMEDAFGYTGEPA